MWSQAMILDSHSEGSEFNTHSDMRAEFSADHQSHDHPDTDSNRIFPLGALPTETNFRGMAGRLTLTISEATTLILKWILWSSGKVL
jgi:hypothetical protein